MTARRTPGRFLVLVSLAVALGPASLLAQRGRPAPPQTVPQRGSQPAAPLGFHGFSVVLVVGGMLGAGATDGVPEAARKALADMKDFLPYKRYQLLDAAWMLCCASGRGGASVSGRLRGLDNRDYSYVIEPFGASDTKLTLHFTLREGTGSSPATLEMNRMSDTAKLEHSRQLYEAIRERDDAQIEYSRAKQRFEVGVVSAPDLEKATQRMRRAEERVTDLQAMAGGGQRIDQLANARAELAALEQRLDPKHPQVLAKKREVHELETPAFARAVMDSTFSIALGETVVIGTSRLNGDQALIALLTAAAKPGTSR